MKYVLAVLSHGYPESDTAEQTLDSFLARVHPLPTWTVFHHDGPGSCYVGDVARAGFQAEQFPEQAGFAGATRRLWWAAERAAITTGCPFVFWLEHDFIFLRDVNLEPMALILRDASIAQVSLVRQPINPIEKQRGTVLDMDASKPMVEGDQTWIRHDQYFTTNPSLMRAGFMRENAWPDESESEGKFGLTLRERGYSFGALGNGSPWVEHIGHLRTGVGY